MTMTVESLTAAIHKVLGTVTPMTDMDADTLIAIRMAKANGLIFRHNGGKWCLTDKGKQRIEQPVKHGAPTASTNPEWGSW